MKAGAYGLQGDRWYGKNNFSTKWYQQETNISLRPEKVDWTSAGLDAVSVGASLVAANSASNAAKVALKVGVGTSTISTVKSTFFDMNPNSVILSSGGFIPGPVGGGFSLASMLMNLWNGVYLGP